MVCPQDVPHKVLREKSRVGGFCCRRGNLPGQYRVFSFYIIEKATKDTTVYKVDSASTGAP